MINLKNSLFLFLLLAGLVIGCSENPLPDPEPEVEQEPDGGDEKEQAPALTVKINRFIKEVMEDIYLWYNTLPVIDILYEFDSKAYFDKLLYEEDKWSFITDDIVALEKSFEGVETSFGYSLAFGRFSNTGNIFAVVEYVYPNTPAFEAGLERGNIIVLMNGADITDENYTDLLYAPSLNISQGILGDMGISVDTAVISMTAKELNLNPVLITNVIEEQGHKIGYLFYAQYISKFNKSLDSAFQYFLDEGISDLVIDLRYNPGGVVTAARHLCSSVAPLNVVTSKNVLVTYQWNDKYQNLWAAAGDRDMIEVTFVDTTVRMGLKEVYFLTGRGTASASELTITGLRPYMNVVTVGETTYGKYTGSHTLKPEYYYDDARYYNDFDNWGIQPITLRYANSQGETDFKNGFSPNIPVDDDLFGGIPLGNKQDPLLKAAIEDITGVAVVAVKKAHIKVPYTIFDRGFSKFDANKRELLFDNMEFHPLMQKENLP
jgi:carboxyl-terminal processing protease